MCHIFISPGFHTGNQRSQSAASTHNNGEKQKSIEGVKIEIIKKPKELKVFVNKSPVPRKEPVENNNKKNWKELEREMVTNRMRTTSSEGNDNHLFLDHSTLLQKLLIIVTLFIMITLFEAISGVAMHKIFLMHVSCDVPNQG